MKKLITGMAIAACFLVACNGSVSVKTDAGTSAAEKNKQTALASEEAFNKHDPAGVVKDCATDFADYGSSDMRVMKNIDSIKTGLKDFMAAFPDYKGENLMAVADSNTVIVTGTWSGTFKNEYMKMKPTGKAVKFFDADIYTFNKDGKITSHRSVQSEATFFAQLGIPMPEKK